jgi:diguanylate cyclase (GGDEF)-like protein/PAS domain S-box-containing protein
VVTAGAPPGTSPADGGAAPAAGLASEITRQVLEHLPQTAIVVFDRDLRFRLVAGPALGDSGMDREKVEGRTLAEIVPGPAAAALSAQYQRALAGETVSMRYRSTLNHHVFWLRILPLTYVDGVVEQAMAVTLDITDQAEAEARVRETIEALDEAQRIASVGSWSWDPSTGRLEWSAEIYRILGRDPASGPATGEELLAYIHPEDQTQLAARFAELSRAAALGTDAFRRQGRILRGGEAELRWLLITGHGPGQPGSPIVGTVQDVTELRQAEIEATRQRDYVQAIIAAAEEGILLSEEGRIVDANPAICRLIGYAREELIGLQAPYPFWPPSAVGQMTAHLDTVAGTGASAHLETSLLCRDGRELPVAVTTVMTAHDASVPATQVSTIRDITRQKSHEAELVRLAAHDPLTGLFNRRSFREHIEHELARSKLHRQPLSLALLDLDHFKKINDRHGHPIGDQVLVEMTRRLQRLSGPEQSIARLGGEEFGWIFPNVTETAAYEAAENARLIIAADPFPLVGRVTVSIGVCQIGRREDADQLYARADDALYRAKARGRNRTERHSLG